MTHPVIASIGTALPPLKMTQADSLAYILANFGGREGTKALYRRVMTNPSVQTRHFAMDNPDEVMEKSLDARNKRFQERGAALSCEALGRALSSAGLKPGDLDFLVTTTCTGYLCPGFSSYIVEGAGLRPNTAVFDLAGMGCGAAVPALRLASDFVAASPGSNAAVVSTEICSTVMVADDDPQLIISNAIFGDGSAAAIITDRPVPGPRLLGFSSRTEPEHRESLRFRTDQGYLRNVLAKEVPALTAGALKEALNGLSPHTPLPFDRLRWILHPGGATVLDAIRDALAIPEERLASSRDILRRCGNMSSPTVLFVLKEEMAIAPPAPGTRGILAAYGAGFGAYTALLEFSDGA